MEASVGERINSQTKSTVRKQNQLPQNQAVRVSPGTAAWASSLPHITSSVLWKAFLDSQLGGVSPFMLSEHSVILLLRIYHPDQ